MKDIEEFFKELWRSDRGLTGTGFAMLGILAVAAVGLAVDPRTVTGAPAWLKPAKFAASIAIYVFTLAYLFLYLPGWVRTRRVVGGITVAAMWIEIVLIVSQAARGTGSHFNVGTVFDAAVFAVMGLAIVTQTLASAFVAAAVWRQEFRDPALGWAFRLGLPIAILGASTGGLMTRPTQAQLEEARRTGRITLSGAHTVGAPDGAPGIPGTGWSVTHGDLRVPHFFGLHAFQILPLAALGIRRLQLADRTRVRVVLATGAVYAGLFAIFLVQALRGEPLIRMDQAAAAISIVGFRRATRSGYVTS